MVSARSFAARLLAQRDHDRQQLAHHALALDPFVARMQRRQLHRDARPLEDRLAVFRMRCRNRASARRDRIAHSARRRARCRRPRPACRRSSDSPPSPSARAFLHRLADGAAEHELLAEDAHGIASPPGGSPARPSARPACCKMPSKSHFAVSSSLTMRPVSISAQVEALTNSESDLFLWLVPIAPSRSCRGSACRRSRCRERAAALRPGTSAPRLPGSTANIPA